MTAGAPPPGPAARVVQAATRLLELCGAGLLFLMMGLTFVDVLGRYLFNRPVAGGFEVTELMLAALVYCGLPLICQRGGHVTVDLFESLVPPRLKRVQDSGVRLLVAVMLVFLGLWLWGKAGDALRYDDTTAILLIPLAPLIYFMAVSSFLSAPLTVAAAVLSGPARGYPRHD